MHASASADTGPVTLTFTRRVRRGREQQYERLVAELQENAKSVRGYLGTSVVHDRDAREYVSIVRFDSLASLQAWEASRQRERWQAQLDGIVEGSADVRRAEGLEFWFERPEHAMQPPSPHKMALVLIVVVSTLALAMAPLTSRYLGDFPRPIRTLISATLQVVLMTYFIMPRVTRALAHWLYPKSGGSHD